MKSIFLTGLALLLSLTSTTLAQENQKPLGDDSEFRTLHNPLISDDGAWMAAEGSNTQRIYKAEQLMSAESKARISAVRSADFVHCGYQDSKGVLWFGTNEGVYRYAEGSFTNLSTVDGLSNNRVFSIMEDKDGVLWFGTENGLCKYDRKTFVHVPIPWSDISSPWIASVYPIVNPNQVTCMLQDTNGAIWIGTNGAGAYRYDGEKFTSFLSDRGRTSDGGTQPNVMTSLLEDTTGHIWFTSISHGGASRFDGESFQHFGVKDGLSDDMIRSSFQDREGKFWFGTHGAEVPSGNRDGGLDSFDGESFVQITSQEGLLNSHVRCIYEDKIGNIWVGTFLGGLRIYDGTKLTPFTTKSGRTFPGVLFIMEDSSGNVWFGGSKGKLLRYDGESVTDFLGKGA